MKNFNKVLGANLANLAKEFGAEKIEHIGGAKFLAIREDGKTLKMLADEGIGSIEGEDGFDEAWEIA